MDINRDRSVLIITNHYLDNKAGGTFASLGYIKAFASLFNDCTLVYPDNGTNVMHLLPPGVKTIPVADTRSKWRKGLGIYYGILHRFTRRASAIMLINKPDIIVFDTSIVSHPLIRLAKKMEIFPITIHHNVEYDYFRDNPPHLSYRFAYRFYLLKAEREAVRSSGLNLTLTDSDSIRLAELYSPGKLNEIRTSGVFEPFQKSSKNILESSPGKISGKDKFAISGNLSFPQSDISTRKFIKKLWPIVRSCIPGCNLIITGKDPSVQLQQLCAVNPDIRLIINPENIERILIECDVYICPVDRGSGFKLRTMDGLKLGMPVLAHEISARGYDHFTKAGYLLVYNSEESFESAVHKLIQNNFDRNKIQQLYTESFSFEHGTTRLKNILEENYLI